VNRRPAQRPEVPGSASRKPGEVPDFPTLLCWHLDEGTRPDGERRPWVQQEFCEAVWSLKQRKHGEFSPRVYSAWRSGQTRPARATLNAMCAVLFPARDPVSPAEKTFRVTWDRFRSRDAQPDQHVDGNRGEAGADDTQPAPRPRPVRTRSVPRPRYPYLARFSISAGAQGDTPEDCRVFLTLLWGSSPVDCPGLTASVELTAFDLHLDAPDYQDTHHFNADNRLKEVGLSAGKWTFTPVPPATSLVGAPTGPRGDDVLVSLTRNAGVNEPRAPVVTGYIPSPDHLKVTIGGKRARKKSSALNAVIEAFLKTCPAVGPHGIDLGSATWSWEEEPDP